MKIITISKNSVTVVALLLVMGSLFGVNAINNLISTSKPESGLEVQKSKPTYSSNKQRSQAMFAPCPTLDYKCRDTVNLSVNSICEATINGDMLFIAPTNLPADTFNVTIVEAGTNLPHANSFTSADVTKIFKVSVSVKGCDNAPCWSYVRIEDKIKPSLVCVNDTLGCSEPLTNALRPVATDACGLKSLDSISTVFTAIPCTNPISEDFVGYYTRKWRAIDNGGRDTICDQLIYIKRPNLDSITVPSTVTVSCDSYTTTFPPMSLSGFLLLDGSPLLPSSETLCMANLTVKDTIISNPMVCTKVVRRTWTLLQWTCDRPIIKTFTQFIYVADTTAPTFASLMDITVGVTNSANCTWTGKLPKINATDNCNTAKITYRVDYPGGTANTNEPTVTLPLGSHTIVYTVTDGNCGNSRLDTMFFYVRDLIAPVALCKKPVLAITSDGTGYLTAKEVNNKSFDACSGLVSIKIRRMESTCKFDTMWKDTVNFCCSDVGLPNLMVALQVIDQDGNINTCMTPVEVQNKNIPSALFPKDTMVLCSLPYNLDSLGNSFGNGSIIGSECTSGGSFMTSHVTNLDPCGTGTITRRFSFIYNGELISRDSQIITIVPDMIATSASITWPNPNVIAQLGRTDTSFTGSPRIANIPCNVVGFSVTNDTLGTAAAGTCFKIFRKFRALNWCGPNKNTPFATFDQIIEVRDTIKPTITTVDTLRSICSFADNCNAKEIVILNAKATDNGPQSLLRWTFAIDLFKNGSIDTTGNTDSIRYLAPVGRHSVTFKVFDQCGSIDSITYDFVVRNCKAPAVKCMGVVTRTMADPDGAGPLQPMVEIKAKDLNAGSEDVCTAKDSLRFTFNMIYPVDSLIYVDHFFKANGMVATLAEYNLGQAQRWIAAERTSIMVFTCSTPKPAMVTVWDLDKNKGVCEVNVILDGCCPDSTNPIITTSDTLRRILNTNPNCAGPQTVTISAAATDGATPINRLKWTYTVDFFKNGSVDSSGMTNSATIGMPVGRHKVTFRVEDTCSNTAMVMYDVEIFNNKRPKANCRTSPYAVTLVDPDGSGPMLPMDTLTALELDNGTTPSFDSCTTDALIYTFGGAYPINAQINTIHYFTGNGVPSTIAAWQAGTAQRWNPATRSSDVKLSCSNNNTSSTYILTVWDTDGNSSTCPVTVNVSGVCPCNDINAPIITSPDTIRQVCSGASTGTNVNLIVNATDVGSPLANLTWVYSLDYGNDGIDLIMGTATGPTVNINPLMPVGTHRVRFVVSDTCANRDTLTYLINIRFCFAAIGDFVWNDLNGNGRQDAGEPGIPGVTVKLLGPTGTTVLKTALTDANGKYCFDTLDVGSYRIDFDTLPGYRFTTIDAVIDSLDSDASLPNGITTVYTLVANQRNKTVDAGFYRPASIGDKVFNDLNANGRQDAGEPGIAGVRVELLGPTGTAVIATLFTDANGLYCFTNLIPGQYRVRFGSPTGFSPTIANASGVADSLDSDPSPLDGITPVYTLVSAQNDKTVDAGFVLASSICQTNPYTGMMVATCNAFSAGNSPDVDQVNEPVAVIYNVKQNAGANTNLNWNRAPFYGPNWTIDSIGQVFGIAIDDSANIFFAHSDVYQNLNNQPANIPPGRIYKSRPPLFKAEVFVTLPNSGGSFNGIGNIVYDRRNNQLFATNLEDGKIYRISNTGMIVQTYDPFTPDPVPSQSGIVTQAEQIWGIGINYEGNATKLYFPRINGATRQMYSLTLTSAGALPGLANSEQLVIANIPGNAPRITDIAFEKDGKRMLFAERGGTIKYGRLDVIVDGPHVAISGQYTLTSGTWNLSRVFSVGGHVNNEFVGTTNIPEPIVFGQNSAGGVTFGPRQVGLDTLAGLDSIVWVSGNWLHKGNRFNPGADDSLYYGVQAIIGNTALGNVKTDIVIDFDNNGSNTNTKGLIGDVEMFPCLLGPVTAFPIIANVSGEIKTTANDEVEGVKVSLIGDTRTQTTTQATGIFKFENVEGLKQYQVAPYKDDDVTNGVNVLDILAIQRHILGINKLDNPYTLIAADINNSKSITIADVVSLRKVVLGITDKFEDNTSWKFVDARHSFATANNPWETIIPETYDITNLEQNMSLAFRGVKIGDIDGSAVANTRNLKGRSANRAILTAEVLVDDKGQTLVPIYAEQANLDGLLLKFNLGSARLVGTKAGQIAIDNRDIYTTAMQANLLYTANTAKVINVSEPLFYLVLEGKADQITMLVGSAMYDVNHGETLLTLRWKDQVKAETVTLHQNTPNPWSEQTTIRFDVPSSGQATLLIYDMSGKKVVDRSLQVSKGENQIVLTNSDLSKGGIYTVILQFGSTQQNKRMVFIAD